MNNEETIKEKYVLSVATAEPGPSNTCSYTITKEIEEEFNKEVEENLNKRNVEAKRPTISEMYTPFCTDSKDFNKTHIDSDQSDVLNFENYKRSSGAKTEFYKYRYEPRQWTPRPFHPPKNREIFKDNPMRCKATATDPSIERYKYLNAPPKTIPTDIVADPEVVEKINAILMGKEPEKSEIQPKEEENVSDENFQQPKKVDVGALKSSARAKRLRLSRETRQPILKKKMTKHECEVFIRRVKKAFARYDLMYQMQSPL